MGCNIHAHIELKKDGRWHHFAAPNIKRNYKLFALMGAERADALVGTGVQPVKHAIGIPGDATETTLICREQDASRGVHNECVLYASEIETLQDRLYELYPDVKRTGIDELDLEDSIFRTYVNGGTIARHDGWDDARIVFWFDN